MPTWAEADAEAMERAAIQQQKDHSQNSLRTRGAAFIRVPGQKRAPYIQARRNRKRAAQIEAEEQAFAETQKASAQAARAEVLRNAKKDGLTEAAAERLANQQFAEAMGTRKSKREKDIEQKVNDEAMKIFDAWDDDGDGTLSPAELRQALALAGFNTQTNFVEEIMEEFDTDGDGFIDKDEFQVMMHALYTGERSGRGFLQQLKSFMFKDSHAIYGNDVLTDAEVENYKAVFHAADESGDMLLDENEVHKLMVSSGLIHGQREFVYDAMRNMDTSGDGAIDFGEFLEFMTRIKEKKKESDNAWSWLRSVGLGVFVPEPPVPEKLAPGYFKVARFEAAVAPQYTKKWCEMQPNGYLVMAEHRGDVMRLAKKNDTSSSKVKHKLQGKKHYEKHNEVIIDFSFVDEVRASATGNAAGTKLEVLTLTETWFFKAESRAVAAEWRANLLAWRDYISFSLHKLASEIDKEAAVLDPSRVAAGSNAWHAQSSEQRRTLLSGEDPLGLQQPSADRKRGGGLKPSRRSGGKGGRKGKERDSVRTRDATEDGGQGFAMNPLAALGIGSGSGVNEERGPDNEYDARSKYRESARASFTGTLAPGLRLRGSNGGSFMSEGAAEVFTDEEEEESQDGAAGDDNRSNGDYSED